MHPIYLWYPNLVGYGRIISTVIAFTIVFTHPLPASVFYATGQLFDAVDGPVARHFHQTSKFGALLDMLTDRLSTATLLIVLSHLYPQHWGLYAALIMLDMASHWCQMYSKLAQNIKTHKGSRNAILNFYYTFPYALLVFCVGNEACFIALYLLSFKWQSAAVQLFLHSALYVSAPVCAAKQLMNVVQLYDACNEVCEMDMPTASTGSSSSSKPAVVNMATRQPPPPATTSKR